VIVKSESLYIVWSLMEMTVGTKKVIEPSDGSPGLTSALYPMGGCGP